MTPLMLLKDVARMLTIDGIPDFNWSKIAGQLSIEAVRDLQVYWVDTQLRSRKAWPQGPEWAPQRARGTFAARTYFGDGGG